MDYPEKIELVLTYKHDPEDTEIFTETLRHWQVSTKQLIGPRKRLMF